MAKKKAAHGGKRKGAGRKPKFEGETVKKLVTVPVSLVEWAESKGKTFSDVVVESLEAARKKSK